MIEYGSRATMPRRLLVTLLAVAALHSAPLSAQDPLPAARDLVQRHVDLVHADLIVERGAIQTVSEFSMAGMGTSGEITVSSAKPNRMVVRMVLPGLGEIASGFNGEVGWSMNPMEGPRLMTDGELKQIRDESDIDANTRSSRLIESMETTELTEVDGTPCYKVKLLWKSGRESFDCYDVATGLLYATMLTSETAMGPVDAVIIFREYKDFNGVLIPTESTQQVFGQELKLKLKTATFGEVDSSAFELPEAIKALVGK